MIRAFAVGEVTVPDWWRVMRRELLSGTVLGGLLGAIGLLRVTLWQQVFGSYGPYWFLVGLTVMLSLVGVVLWGTLAGSMLPFIMKRIGADPRRLVGSFRRHPGRRDGAGHLFQRGGPHLERNAAVT